MSRQRIRKLATLLGVVVLVIGSSATVPSNPVAASQASTTDSVADPHPLTGAGTSPDRADPIDDLPPTDTMSAGQLAAIDITGLTFEPDRSQTALIGTDRVYDHSLIVRFAGGFAGVSLSSGLWSGSSPGTYRYVTVYIDSDDDADTGAVGHRIPAPLAGAEYKFDGGNGQLYEWTDGGWERISGTLRKADDPIVEVDSATGTVNVTLDYDGRRNTQPFDPSTARVVAVAEAVWRPADGSPRFLQADTTNATLDAIVQSVGQELTLGYESYPTAFDLESHVTAVNSSPGVTAVETRTYTTDELDVATVFQLWSEPVFRLSWHAAGQARAALQGLLNPSQIDPRDLADLASSAQQDTPTSEQVTDYVFGSTADQVLGEVERVAHTLGKYGRIHVLIAETTSGPRDVYMVIETPTGEFETVKISSVPIGELPPGATHRPPSDQEPTGGDGTPASPSVTLAGAPSAIANGHPFTVNLTYRNRRDATASDGGGIHLRVTGGTIESIDSGEFGHVFTARHNATGIVARNPASNRTLVELTARTKLAPGESRTSGPIRIVPDNGTAEVTLEYRAWSWDEDDLNPLNNPWIDRDPTDTPLNKHVVDESYTFLDYDTYTATVPVSPEAPWVNVSGVTRTSNGAEVTFTGADPDGRLAEYRFRLADGSWRGAGDGSTTVTLSNGNYRLDVQAVDSVGRHGPVDLYRLVIENGTAHVVQLQDDRRMIEAFGENVTTEADGSNYSSYEGRFADPSIFTCNVGTTTGPAVHSGGYVRCRRSGTIHVFLMYDPGPTRLARQFVLDGPTEELSVHVGWNRHDDKTMLRLYNGSSLRKLVGHDFSTGHAHAIVEFRQHNATHYDVTFIDARTGARTRYLVALKRGAKLMWGVGLSTNDLVTRQTTLETRIYEWSTTLEYVPHRDPAPYFTATPPTPEHDDTVTLDASGSVSLEGSVERYEWDLDDDGEFENQGSIVTHRFGSAGNYSVSLRVTDDAGVTATTTREIAVGLGNLQPIAELNHQGQSGDDPLSVTLDGTESHDPDGTGVTCSWDVDDDGTFEATGCELSHTFPEPGFHRVTLRVTDEAGKRESTSTYIGVSRVRRGDPSAWVLAHHDPANTGDHREAAGIRSDVQATETITLNHSIPTAPAATDTTLFVAGGTGETLTAVNRTTDTIEWQHGVGSWLMTTPAVRYGVVYVGDVAGTIYALDTSDGTAVWSLDTGGKIETSPTVVNGTVYVAANFVSRPFKSPVGRLYALDARTGEKQWTRDVGDGVYGAPAVANGTVYVASRDANTLSAFDADSGAHRWSTSLGTGLVGAPSVRNGTVYVGGENGSLFALRSADGKTQWSYNTSGSVRFSPAVASGTVFTVNADGDVHALAAEDGSIRWTASVGEFSIHSSSIPQIGSPAIAGETLYVPADWQVYGFDIDSGRELWRVSNGGRGIAVVNGSAYSPVLETVYELNGSVSSTTCIEASVAGPDRTISLTEIQRAINWWASDTLVPDTDGQRIGLSKIQGLINAWAEDSPVSC